MATGTIKDLFPSGNDGSQDGAATATDSSTGNDYVFFTPQDVTSGSVPLSAGTKVNFDINGNVAANVQKITG